MLYKCSTLCPVPVNLRVMSHKQSIPEDGLALVVRSPGSTLQNLGIETERKTLGDWDAGWPDLYSPLDLPRAHAQTYCTLCTQLTKETGMEEREVYRWLRRKARQGKSPPIRKFAESLFKVELVLHVLCAAISFAWGKLLDSLENPA